MFGTHEIGFKLTLRVDGQPAAQGTPLSKPLAPNDLWCADYKGEFMAAGDRGRGTALGFLEVS